MDLEDKVLRAKKGDEEAFFSLIQERKEMLYKMAYLYVKNEQDALDIVGDTVFKAINSIKNLKSPQYFQTWLMRILINCALAYVKKQQKIVPLHDDITEKIEVLVPKEDYMDLYDAIDRLPYKYRTVVILKYFNDLTVTQISQVLESPTGTIKSLLHRAIQELRMNLTIEEEAK